MPLGRPVTAGMVTCDPRHNGIERSGEADRAAKVVATSDLNHIVAPDGGR
jgi:hypothetical protein